MSEASTHDRLKPQLEALHTAQTALANAEMILTGDPADPAEDFEAWEGVVWAVNVEDAAEALSTVAREKVRDAEALAEEGR